LERRRLRAAVVRDVILELVGDFLLLGWRRYTRNEL
jgi:hypothetical protein